MKLLKIFFLAFFYLSITYLKAENIDEFSTRIKKLNNESHFDSSILLIKSYSFQTKSENILIYKLLGDTYKSSGDFKNAFFYYTKAEKMVENLTDYPLKISIYTSLIEYYRYRQKYGKANEYIKLGNTIINTNKIPNSYLAQFYGRCAAVETEGNQNLKQSLYYSSLVIDIAIEEKDKFLEASAYNEYAYVLEIQNDKNALKYYLLSYEILKKSSKPSELSHICSNLGRMYIKLNDLDKAILFYNEAVKIAEDNNILDQKVACYYALFQIYNLNKNYKLALENYLIYHKNFDLNERKINANLLEEIETKYNVQKKEEIIAFQNEKVALSKKEAKNKNNLLLISIFFLVVLSIFLTYNILLSRKLKKTNDILAKNIEQKELIYKELQHRVKNNLTTLKSILYLHSKSSDNQKVIEALNDCQSRLQAMAIVNQKLTNDENVGHVELKSFLYELVADVESSFLESGKSIDIICEEHNLQIDISTAVVIGIIINELTTNSVKYAQTVGQNLKISIHLNRQKNNLKIMYSDNGKGLPKEQENLSNGGFGLKLIQIMLKQIKTKMEYQRIDNQPCFYFTLNDFFQ